MTSGSTSEVGALIRSNVRLLGKLLLISTVLIAVTLGGVAGILGGEHTGPDESSSPTAWMTGAGAFDAADTLTGDGNDRAVLSIIGHDSIDALLLVTTYSKYNDVSPLEHEVRSELMGLVTALPGLYVAQIVGRTDHSPSTIRYHAKILEREELLTTATFFGNRRLFPASVDQSEFGYLAALREPATARLIEAIEKADGSISPSELATTIDRAPSTVSYHLARLEEAAVIWRERNGNHVSVSLQDVARERSGGYIGTT